MGICISNWDWGLGLILGIWDLIGYLDWGFEFAIVIGEWDWGFEIGIGDRDWGLGLGTGIGDLD